MGIITLPFSFILLSSERAEETSSTSLRKKKWNKYFEEKPISYFPSLFWKSDTNLAITAIGKLIKYRSYARHSGTYSDEFQMVLKCVQLTALCHSDLILTLRGRCSRAGGDRGRGLEVSNEEAKDQSSLGTYFSEYDSLSGKI